MASLQDTIKILIQADGAQAVREIERVGKTSQQQLDKTGKATRDWSAALTRTGAGLVGFAAVSGAALYKTAQAASDLSETVNKTNVIFGDAADQVIAYGDDASQSIGQSKQAALEAASTFGGLAKGIGLTADESADFAIKLTTLSSDLASFGNTTPEEAVLALGSALRGESEPIRKYNVLLNEAAIKTEAYASGIAKQGEELTEQQKVQARYNVILKQTSDAQGDFARTSDGAANQQRILSAQLKDLQANVGTGLLPIFTQLVSSLNTVTGQFADLSPTTQSFIGKMAGISVVAAGAGGSLLLVAGQASKLRDALTEVGDTGQRSMTKVGRAVTGITGIIAVVGILRTIGAQFEPGARGADRFTSALERFGNTGVASGVVADSFGRNLEDLDRKLKLASVSGRDAASIGFVLGDAFGDGRTEVQQAKKDFESLDDTLSGLAAGGSADVAASSFLKLVEATKAQGGSVDELLERLPQFDAFLSDVADGTIKLTGYTKEQRKELREAAVAAGFYGIALGGLGDKASGAVGSALKGLARELDDTTDAVDGQKGSVEDLVLAYDEFYDRVLGRQNTLRDGAKAQLDVADALAQVEEAQARYNELVAAGTASSGELAQAQRDVQRATIDYYGSVDDAANAIFDATAIQAGFERGTKNSKKETDSYIGALKAQRDTLSGPLRDAVSNYIAQLEAIPASKKTKVEVDTTVADEQLRQWERTVNGRVVTYYVNAEGVVSSPGAPDMRASGGPVTAGKPYIVGEQGMELFVPNTSGTIVPNHALRGGAGSPLGGEVIHVHFHGPVAGSQRAMERMMVDALKSARRRGDRDVA